MRRNTKKKEEGEEREMSLSLFSHLSISSSLLLLLLFSIESSSATRALFRGAAKSTAARALNRGRKNIETAEFLLAHNTARAATGASSLVWDKNLTRFASNWAKQRKADCEHTHSHGPYGENLMWYKRSETWSPKRVVAKWVEESLYYDPKTNTCKSGEMCGHYTQIIWRSTTAVGCATVKCDNSLGFLVFCEYSPQGNVEGQTPFDMP